MVVERVIIPMGSNHKIHVEEKKAKTMASLLKSIIRYIIYFLTIMIVLDLLDIQTAPILASAGIIGLAVGFGAQNLVRDVITGFFLIFEDQFSIGDYIAVAGVEGIVEEIGFRTTKIRDFGGQLHIVPNGSIDKVTNFVTGNMRVLVEVMISYDEDVERVLHVLDACCVKAAQDLDVITDGPRVLGVQELADSGIKILIWAKTKPMEQWAISRELRKRVKEAFDEENITIPYPHFVIVSDRKQLHDE
jgi:small conductance mechanosensitive channel